MAQLFLVIPTTQLFLIMPTVLVHKNLLLSNIFYQIHHFCLFQFFLSSFHYMLSNKLQFSPSTQLPDFSKTQHPQPSTSETLTQLNSGNSPDSEFYFNNQHTDLQLLQYTLNLGHSYLSSLQYLKEDLYRKANDQMQSQKTQYRKIQYIQNLENLSELSTISLIKIGEQRKRIRQKLLGYLLIKSKQTNKKTIIKSNILKCKQALSALKMLKDQNFQTEQQIMHLKLRLTTCGLILVPGLIEKCIIGLAFKILLQKKVRLTISQASNLRIIIEGFLENHDIMQKAWQMFFNQNLVEHTLYAKFKIFIILKAYIDDKCNGNKLFQLFKEAIENFLKMNINKVTLIQHNKIQSLVQSDQHLRIFWQKTAKNQIQHTLLKAICFISEVQKKNQRVKCIFDQFILNRNKGFRDRNKLKVSKEITKFILQSDLFPSIQSINTLLTIVTERKGFFRNSFIQHNLEVSPKDIQFCISFHCLKSFLFPLKNMIISMNSLIYRDKKQKHYHNYRFVHRNLLIWQKILNQFEYQSQKTNEILKKLRSMEQNKANIKQCNIKQEKQKLFNSKYDKDQQMISICELFIYYNNALGERYLYTANKLINSIVQDSEFIEENINLKNNKQPQMGLEHLMSLWVSLIGEKVCDHLLYELQPANVLPTIRFLQDEIVQSVERQHTIENQLDKLWREVQKMDRSKRTKDSTEEQIHGRVWQLNLKTRNYEKLLLISKSIKLDNELKQMNEKIYKQIFSNQFK